MSLGQNMPWAHHSPSGLTGRARELGGCSSPVVSVGCVPKEPGGLSLAGLQVTSKAVLCKQEISISHWDPSKMRLGLDNGASRHPASPGDSTLHHREALQNVMEG